MHSLSIKYFSIFAILFLLSGTTVTFYNFYNTTKLSISELLKNDIQNNALDIKHFLDSELKIENIKDLIAHLDRIAASNNVINDIHILNNNNTIIYSSDRLDEKSSATCKEISLISKEIVLDTPCYSFSIRLHKGLQPYYYKSNIFINTYYLNNLLYNNTIRILIYFAILLLFFFVFLWFALQKIIVLPLESLRQFAYYSSKVPKEFFISEIESIRYSLAMTFSRLKKEQEELYKLSTKDSLSGLYNRMSLMEKVKWLISSKDRKEESFAVIFLDLDNFKNINDSMGHDTGDKVLKQVALILLHAVRENDIVSRIGGDEFIIVLPDIENDTSVIDILERVKAQLKIPLHLKNSHHVITASMGIALYPRDGEDVHTLLKNADIAMYRSKELGKNHYHFFTDSLNQILQEKLSMQNILMEALQNDYFELYYQPKTDVQTGKIIACEALIRLIHPKEGLIPPDRFIPLAEENNFIIQIGEWVISQASKQAKLWSTTELQKIKISLNVSAKQLQNSNLLPTLKNAIKGVDTSQLDIELTESVFINGLDTTQATIKEIKSLGISLSLDDFGTGYSSLSYLKRIPFDTIKIDKSFIDDLELESGKNFTDMIVEIAKTLKMEVVAEGVETEKQLAHLKKINCDTYQGYLCSKPLPVEDFEKLVHRVNSL
jgi:diguanylate cyclase (GGDEF)-like protein